MKKQKVVVNLLIVILLLVIVAILISSAMYAWAKYRSNQGNNASADIAKWYFKVIGNSEQDLNNINFSMTRIDENRYS